MGADYACLSDASRSWLEIKQHFVGLSCDDISRVSVTSLCERYAAVDSLHEACWRWPSRLSLPGTVF
jgi:hypothetical protein